ncbi:MAG: hypothetical protein KF715_08390 [Candidatus Didemnitutus sp.]|nr:hypothetical protein [Candidatus Didemnitutus sp.]
MPASKKITPRASDLKFTRHELAELRRQIKAAPSEKAAMEIVLRATAKKTIKVVVDQAAMFVVREVVKKLDAEGKLPAPKAADCS